MADMKALSIRAPWWWFILHGGKNIENRDWLTRYRGPVLIHASKWWNMREIGDDTDYAKQVSREAGGFKSGAGTTFRKMKAGGGCIVGKAEIVDCVSESASPWFAGKYGFVLANPVALAEPIPCKGALSFFTVPGNVLAQIKERVHV